MNSFEESTRSRKRKCRRNCCIGLPPCCLFLSLLLITVALLLYFILPRFMMSFIDKKLLILPGNAPYVQLSDPILPLYKDVYFYNLTNIEAFADGTEQPQLHEVGPYSYREVRRKFFNESSLNWSKTRLTYTQQKTYHFSHNTSGRGLNEDDIICTINLVMVAVIAEVLKIDNIVERDLAVEAAKVLLWETKAKIYICQQATSLVFNFTDPLIQELHKNEILKFAKMNFPLNYVSLQLNASSDDLKPSVIDTGVDNVSNTGQYINWDGKDMLDIWYDKYANMINGTEGMFFKPHLKEGDGVVAFVDDACRSIPLSYVGKAKIKGFDTYRYELAAGVFDSAFKNPANARWGSWCPDGLFYLGAIQKPGVPVFGSKPRFLDADPTDTTDKIKILPPDRAKQDTYAYVHPMLGLTLEFSRSIQFNLQINHTTKFSHLKHFTGTTYFPVFYVTEHAELNEEVKSYILKQGIQLYRIVNVGWKVIFGVLLLLALIGLVLTCVFGYKAIILIKRGDYVLITN